MNPQRHHSVPLQVRILNRAHLLIEAFSSADFEANTLFQRTGRNPQNQDVKIRVLALGVVCGATLCAQHRFSWQDSCFKNPGLPYCQGRDFAVKHNGPAKDGTHATAGANPDSLPEIVDTVAPSVIVVGGIDWRFADPQADMLVRLRSSKFAASPLARNLMTQLGTSQGLAEADMRKIFDGLSIVDQVALSIRGDRILLMIGGHAADVTARTTEAGWKAVPVVGNGILIGPAEAVDQAVQRMAKRDGLAELARSADQDQGYGDFYAIGSAPMIGQEAVASKVKRFSLTASIQDRLTSYAAFEFDGAPDMNTLPTWPASFSSETTIDVNVVHLKMSVESDQVQQNLGQIAGSPFGRCLGTLIRAARYLPVRDTTVHTKPVIYGLDDGPKELRH